MSGPGQDEEPDPPSGRDGSNPQRGPEPDPPSRPQPRTVDLFALGMACAIAIVLAGGIGYLLDNWLGTTPILTFVGLAFGITSAVLLTVARVRKYL